MTDYRDYLGIAPIKREGRVVLYPDDFPKGLSHNDRETWWEKYTEVVRLERKFSEHMKLMRKHQRDIKALCIKFKEYEPDEGTSLETLLENLETLKRY